MPSDGQAGPSSGAEAHFRALESLYRSAPINALFRSDVEIGEGVARIRFDVEEGAFHAAGAAHGTIYFKMLDDAAFYACNSLVNSRLKAVVSRKRSVTRLLHA